jgi:hypothetical protein
MSFSAREIAQALASMSDIVDKQSVTLALRNKQVISARTPSKLADTVSFQQTIIGVVVTQIESGHGLSLSSILEQAHLTVVCACSQDVVTGQSQRRHNAANASSVSPVEFPCLAAFSRGRFVYGAFLCMYVEDGEGIFCASDKVVVVDKEEGRGRNVCFGEVVLPCVGCVGICEIEGVGQTDGQVWL